MHIKQSLDMLVANALESGPHQNDAWVAIVGLSSYLARVISERAIEAMEL